MKTILMLSFFIAGQVMAAATCDLSVQVKLIEGEKQISKTFTVENRIVSESDQENRDVTGKKLNVVHLYNARLTKEQAIEKCSEEFENCQITDYNTRDVSYIPTFKKVVHWDTIHIAKATGTNTVGGVKLTDAQVAKKRLIAVCGRLNSCIHNGINDETASANYMEKLYQAKERNNCNQVENFIFTN